MAAEILMDELDGDGTVSDRGATRLIDPWRTSPAAKTPKAGLELLGEGVVGQMQRGLAAELPASNMNAWRPVTAASLPSTHTQPFLVVIAPLRA